MTKKIVPTLTREQRLENSQRARITRRTRLEALWALQEGRVKVAEFLWSDDPAIKSLKVSQVLASLPNSNSVLAQRILEETGIEKQVTIAGLGISKRVALLSCLSEAREKM